MFTLDVEGSSEDLGVVRFTAHEAISALFELRVEVASATPLPLDGLIDRPALLTIEGLEATRYIHGVICEAAYIGETSSKTLHELPRSRRTCFAWSCRPRTRRGTTACNTARPTSTSSAA
jgi:uncharacterized protein involved in type VI secretion and phage assembly